MDSKRSRTTADITAATRCTRAASNLNYGTAWPCHTYVLLYLQEDEVRTVRPEHGPPSAAAATATSWTAMFSKSRSPGSLSKLWAASRQAFDDEERPGVLGDLKLCVVKGTGKGARKR